MRPLLVEKKTLFAGNPRVRGPRAISREGLHFCCRSNYQRSDLKDLVNIKSQGDGILHALDFARVVQYRFISNTPPGRGTGDSCMFKLDVSEARAHWRTLVIQKLVDYDAN